MTRLTNILFCLFCLFTISSPIFAEDAKSLFQSGIKSFEEKKFEDALKSFTESSKQDPLNVANYINAGLTSMELKKKGQALGFFRKALFVDPTSPEAAKAIQFISSQLEVKDIPHEIETYSLLRNKILINTSVTGLNTLVAICFFCFAFLMIRYWGKYKKAVQKEEAPPTTPYVAYLLGIVMFLFIGLLILKSYDESLSRGTIVAEKVSVHTAPGEQQAVLFELYEGLEVEILMTQPDWVQIQYPGASSGWIPATSLMKTQ